MPKKIDELLKEDTEKSDAVDTSIFDETLKEINQILISLEQKSDEDESKVEGHEVLPEIKSAISKINLAKKELTKQENNLFKNNNLIERIEVLEKKIANLNESNFLYDNLKKETSGDTKEHEIDKNLLPIEELHAFEESDKKKKKNQFGFYSYLVLTIVIFLVFYGALNSFKDLIILKYPMTELYINYFYEIIEILKITILGFYSFVKNII
jgi:hypothetical protein|tara:strand:- start:206 stop:838 length:633 start_codon:yes stop_codon:yes gene_type:complete